MENGSSAPLAGRGAIVAGASREVGATMAEALAGHGAAVVEAGIARHQR
jgi:NAD(P)-dependent dehydrogenase (short-subunit alcohol dehydrogenase family)